MVDISLNQQIGYCTKCASYIVRCYVLSPTSQCLNMVCTECMTLPQLARLKELEPYFKYDKRFTKRENAVSEFALVDNRAEIKIGDNRN